MGARWKCGIDVYYIRKAYRLYVYARGAWAGGGYSGRGGIYVGELIMGVLGNVVGDAVNAYTGNSSGTNLESFLSKFSNAKGRYVDTIDPLGTFDVKFKFYPTVKAVAEVDKWTKVG